MAIIAPLPWLSVWGVAEQTRALIDTGSSLNLISERLLKRFEHRSIGQYHVNVLGVHGEPTSFMNWFMVTVIFSNGREVEIPMLAGLDENIGFILGTPFLKTHNGTIHMLDNYLRTNFGTFALGEQESKAATLTVGSNALMVGEPPAKDELDPMVEEGFKDTMISQEGVIQIRQLLREFKEVWDPTQIGRAVNYQHEFLLTDYRPVRLPPRHIQPKWYNEIEKQTNNMLEKDVIEPSNSPYRFYPVLAQKKDGEVRFAIDFRGLNSVTVADRYPIPRIEEIFAEIKASTHFVLLDLSSGFWHIPLNPSQRHFTAFSTHRGHWQFKRLPFGVINGPASFQRWMDIVLGDLRKEGVLVYIDDILIHATSEATLIDLLGQVLWRLSIAGAKIKLSKCHFGSPSFEYLGHLVEGATRKPQQRKLLKYKSIKPPECVKDVRSIMGMLNYYRVYIPHMADLARPLTKALAKSRQQFKWSRKQQHALRKMIKILEKAVLELAPTGNIFRLETDASNIGMGAVLYDKEKYDANPKGVLPILFMSKTFSGSQVNWSVNDRELYAVLWALEHSQTILSGKEVHVYTDHKNLQSIIKSDTTPKVTRWLIRMANFNPVIHYIKGKENVVADFLSRHLVDDVSPDHMLFSGVGAAIKRTCPLPEHEKIAVREKKRQKRLKVEQYQPLDVADPSYHSELDFPTQWRSILKKPPEDTDIEEVPRLHFVQDYDFPTMEELKIAQAKEPPGWTRGYFTDKNGYIGYMKGFWVPPSLRRQVLDAVHLNSCYLHPGQQKMKALLRRMYDWKGFYKDISDYVHSCLTCQRNRPLFHRQEAMEHKHPLKGPHEHVYMDIWGPVTFNGTKFQLLTIMDYFTKWAEAAVLPDTTSESIAKAFFTEWICRHGSPAALTTDNGSNFTAAALSRVCQILGITQLRSTTYHPKGNAPVEQFHRTLKKVFRYLRICAPSCTDIKELVAYALLLYRMMPHDATKQSPAYLTYGTDFVLRNSDYSMANVDLDTNTRSRLESLGQYRQDLLQQYSVQKQCLQEEENNDRKFKIGDLVLLHLTDAQRRTYSKRINSSKKFTPEWSLPMRVQYTGPKGNTATLMDVVTGYVQRSHLDRVRFLKPPMTPGLKNEWIHILKEEHRHFLPQKKIKDKPQQMSDLPNPTDWVDSDAATRGIAPVTQRNVTFTDDSPDMIYIPVDEEFEDEH